MTLPAWVPPDTNKPAPMPLLLVQSFVNTLDLEQRSDLLLDRAASREWLAASELIAADAAVTDSELADARAVREALRVLLEHNGGGPAPTEEQLAPLRELAARRQASVEVGPDGAIGLACEGDLMAGLLSLLLTVSEAQADGTWSRLKVCANPECGWAFYDRSRNQQGAWCSMAVCGNRLKNRRFRARDLAGG